MLWYRGFLKDRSNKVLALILSERLSMYQVNARNQQVKDRNKILGSRVIDFAAHNGWSHGSERLDDGYSSLRLNWWSEPAIGLGWNRFTSVNASREGIARSRIGWSIKSGSIILMDFKQLWMFETVEESSENMASKTTVRRDFTSSLFMALVSRQFCEVFSLWIQKNRRRKQTIGVAQSGWRSSYHPSWQE